MKPKILLITCFVVLTLTTVIVLFALNKFLFFLRGFTYNDLNNANPKAFEAFKKVYWSKVFIIVGGFVASLVLLFFAQKYINYNPVVPYKIIYAACWLITIIYLILLLLLVVLPKGPLV